MEAMKDYIKDGAVYYVSSKQGTSSEYFKVGFFVKDTYKEEKHYMNSKGYYDEIYFNNLRDTYVKLCEGARKNLAEDYNLSMDDISHAMKLFKRNHSKNKKELIAMLMDKPLLDERWYYYSRKSSYVNVDDEVSSHLTFIGHIKFDKIPENRRKCTFDYIQIDIGISGIDSNNKKEWISENIKEIYNFTLNRLKVDRRFLRYSVPINILKVEYAVLTKTGMLHICFGIKDIPEEKKEEAI